MARNYLRKNILDKLGMVNSGVDRLDSILPLRARGYSKVKSKYVNAEFISLAWPFSAGILYSTIDDMYKWDRALYGTSVISSSSKQKMFTPLISIIPIKEKCFIQNKYIL